MIIALLRAYDVLVEETSAPKQSETTQRWKVGLRAAGRAELIRTKIEFSRRKKAGHAAFESIDAEVARSHSLPPFLATHYVAPGAATQKIHALADRQRPQARDVFDLNHLFARPDTTKLKLSSEERSWVPRAIARVTDLSFDEYAGQVVAFLDPEQRALYSSRDTWVAMQVAVIERLETLA
jgi:hypothetical protein